MNKSKKVILLLLVLGFPIMLILIFEFDSEGVYEVPLLYEEGVYDVPTACNYQYAEPYILPDSVRKNLLSLKPDLVIVSFDTISGEAKRNLNRIKEQFEGDNVSIKTIGNAQESVLKKCVFLAQGDSSLVLIDLTGRIRGYYNATRRDEIDRLFDESKIILGNISHGSQH